VAVSVRRGKRVVARARARTCPPAGACCACNLDRRLRPARYTVKVAATAASQRVVATRHVRVRRARR
jgi:hypothetical protein